MSLTEVFVDYSLIPMGQLETPGLDFLWIGSKRDASDLEALRSRGISFIVNCTRDHMEGGIKNFHEKEPGFRYCRVPIKDNDSEILNLYVLQDAWRFITRAKDAGCGCLIHCAMGKSRSSAVLVSYIMHVTGMTYEDALELVRKCRQIVEPNTAFADQLRYFYLSGDIKKTD